MGLFPRNECDVLCLIKQEGGSAAEFKPIGKAEETGEWHGIPIVKETPEQGYHNPITVQDLVATLNFLGISPEDTTGINVIVIAGRSPYTDELNSGWAFGAYQVIWQEQPQKNKQGRIVTKKMPKENRIILWAQKIEKVQFNVGGELREGFYYRVQPVYHGQSVDRYISVRALRREILGDTIAHEIGHHVDIWHYGRMVKSSSDRRKAEKFAESYAELHTRKKVNQADFESIIDGTYAQQSQQAAPVTEQSPVAAPNAISQQPVTSNYQQISPPTQLSPQS